MSEVLRAPFPWFGGKSRCAGVVWSMLGDVPNYVEPFAGSLAVLLGRPHTPKTSTPKAAGSPRMSARGPSRRARPHRIASDVRAKFGIR